MLWWLHTISTRHILIKQREHFITLLKSSYHFSPATMYSLYHDNAAFHLHNFLKPSEPSLFEMWTYVFFLCFHASQTFMHMDFVGGKWREVIEDTWEVSVGGRMEPWLRGAGQSCWAPSVPIWTVFISLRGQYRITVLLQTPLLSHR